MRRYIKKPRTYRKKPRTYRRRTKNNKKTNKHLTKNNRKSSRKTRKQKAGNPKLIAAAVAATALGAGLYYNKMKRRYNTPGRREPPRPPPRPPPPPPPPRPPPRPPPDPEPEPPPPPPPKKCRVITELCEPNERPKRCFHRMSLKGDYRHPDKGGETEAFQKLNNCYDQVNQEWLNI